MFSFRKFDLMFFIVTFATFKFKLNNPTLSKVDPILNKKYNLMSLYEEIFARQLSNCKIVKEINFKLRLKNCGKKNK